MSDSFVAIKGTYFVLFFILFLHSWISLLFYMNKLNAKGHLEHLSANITFPTLFNQVIDLKSVDIDEQCSVSYSEYQSFEWPGTGEGVYIQGKDYSGHTCQFTDCTGRNVYDDYINNKCYTVSRNNILTVCCDFTVDTINSNSCSNVYNNCCRCHDIYTRKSMVDLTKAIDRKVILFPEIPPIRLDRYNNKKLCYKNITDFTLFDETCEDGVYCFGYICIKGINSCPDYKSVFNITNDKALTGLYLKYNSVRCSIFSEESQKIKKVKIEESEHYLSNFNLKYFSYNNMNACKYNNDSSYYKNEDSFVARSYNSQVYYNMTGIYPLINENIDKLTLSNDYKYYPKLTDTIFFSATTHFTINSTNKKCRTDIFRKIQPAIDIAKDSINGSGIKIFNYLSLAFLVIIIATSVFFFLKIGSIDTHDFNPIRIVLITNISFFIFNLIVYFMSLDDNDKYNSNITTIKDLVECFNNKNLVNYLENIKFGLFNYNIIYNMALQKILIENSLVLSLIIILISPICNVFGILGIKYN